MTSKGKKVFKSMRCTGSKKKIIVTLLIGSALSGCNFVSNSASSDSKVNSTQQEGSSASSDQKNNIQSNSLKCELEASNQVVVNNNFLS